MEPLIYSEMQHNVAIKLVATVQERSECTRMLVSQYPKPVVNVSGDKSGLSLYAELLPWFDLIENMHLVVGVELDGSGA